MTKEESQQWIGEQIAELRKQKGLSHIELAELTGLSRTHIWRIESGKYNAGFYQIHTIINALGLKIKFTK